MMPAIGFIVTAFRLCIEPTQLYQADMWVEDKDSAEAWVQMLSDGGWYWDSRFKAKCTYIKVSYKPAK